MYNDYNGDADINLKICPLCHVWVKTSLAKGVRGISTYANPNFPKSMTLKAKLVIKLTPTTKLQYKYSSKFYDLNK